MFGYDNNASYLCKELKPKQTTKWKISLEDQDLEHTSAQD